MPASKPTGFPLFALFLAGPLLMLGEMLRPIYAAPLLALAAVWLAVRGGEAWRNRAAGTIGRPTLLAFTAAFAICCVWLLLSGTGGFGICRWDHEKHNFIFGALLDHQLPIALRDDGKRFLLHYGFAFYITPLRITWLLDSVIGGIDPVVVTFALYAIVLYLALRLLAATVGVPILLLVVVMVFAGGFDLPGMVLFQVPPDLVMTSRIATGIPRNLEWWGVVSAPQSATHALYWAPQHFLGALIGVALLLRAWSEDRPAAAAIADSIVIVAAGAYWSPYVAVGLAAIAAVTLTIDRRRVVTAIDGWRGIAAPGPLVGLLFGLVLAALAAAFYLAAKPLSRPGLLPTPDTLLAWGLTFVLNFAPILIALAILRLGRSPPETETERRRLAALIGGLLAASAILLVFRHGFYNDWAMRTVEPLWIAAMAATVRVVALPLSVLSRWVLVGALVLSSASSLAEIAQSAIGRSNCKPYGAFKLEDLGFIKPQYEGERSSFFYRVLARRPGRDG